MSKSNNVDFRQEEYLNSENSENSENREISRRMVYLEEKIIVDLQSQKYSFSTFLIDISCKGIAVITEKISLFSQIDLSEEYTMNIVPNSLNNLSLVGKIIHKSIMHRQEKDYLKLGIEFINNVKLISESRRSERFEINNFFYPVAYFEHPFFIWQRIYLQIIEINKYGFKCRSSKRNNLLIPGLFVRLMMYFPLLDKLELDVLIRHVDLDQSYIICGVEIKSNLDNFNNYCGKLLAITESKTDFLRLREEGINFDSIKKYINFDFIKNKDELQEIAKIRYGSYKKEEREKIRLFDMIDEFDSYSRHLVARLNSKIIASSRIVFNNGQKERCEHLSYGAKIPDWLWNVGFVEIGRLVIDEKYRKSDIFMAMTSFIGKTVIEAGYKYMISSCVKSLEKVYIKSGCKKIGEFVIAGENTKWSLLVIDVTKSAKGRGIDPITWNLIHRDVLYMNLLKKNMKYNFFDLIRINFYKLFSGLSDYILNKKILNKNKK